MSTPPTVITAQTERDAWEERRRNCVREKPCSELVEARRDLAAMGAAYREMTDKLGEALSALAQEREAREQLQRTIDAMHRAGLGDVDGPEWRARAGNAEAERDAAREALRWAKDTIEGLLQRRPVRDSDEVLSRICAALGEEKSR